MLVSLLVGAKYGMSQVINHKLNVISTLVEFSSISRVELLSESDKVSLLRISLHDMKVRTAPDQRIRAGSSRSSIINNRL